jgi:hypothetical protein
MPDDIGENLVGSYLRYVGQCDFVLFNSFLPLIQGEIDVIGLRLTQPRQVWFCEVTTHILGMQYGPKKESTVQKLRDKLDRAGDFAQAMFPNDAHRYEIWSPVVSKGWLTDAMAVMEQEFNDASLDVHFVINEEYAKRIQALIDVARKDTRATSEPAYRLLQVLTRVKGKLVI